MTTLLSLTSHTRYSCSIYLLTLLHPKYIYQLVDLFEVDLLLLFLKTYIGNRFVLRI
jgi:hypothetical protein